MVIDESTPKQSSLLKRNRDRMELKELTPEETELKLKSINEELENLLKCFDEVMSVDLGLGFQLCNNSSSNSLNTLIAVFLEEKKCSYSKLVGGLYEKVKEKENVTIVIVKSSVLFVGQRVVN
ncbi:unnamed protein product [Amaranthus hypochondriacus]